MKFLKVFIIFGLLSTPAFAECDFSTGIKKVEGGFLYTEQCHLKVGQMNEQLELKDRQIKHLEKSIELKDLAISKYNERIELWMNTSYKLEERINKIDRMNDFNKWLYFGIGVAVTGIAVYGAGQLK